jgi:hypothetical protein
MQYIAMDPHASTSETFAMFKKQEQGADAEFILRFGDEPVQSRLSSRDRLDLKQATP